MMPRLLPFIVLALYGMDLVLLAKPSVAQSAPLTRAVIQSVRNQVRLIPRNRNPRSAQVSDTMTPGDALSTAASSLAELRFNDGSLARVGERAVFRFVSQTRTFELSNGTMLLLIPPKRGGTRIRTPNATAGIRGSAIFARYNAETQTTLFGALTNNPAGPIVILTENGTQQPLRAGEMAVVVQGQLRGLYKFDLTQFYQTSELVKELNLTQSPSSAELAGESEAIAQVRTETVEALQGQSPVQGSGVIENPDFIQLSGGVPTNPTDMSQMPDPLALPNVGAAQSGNMMAPTRFNNAASIRDRLTVESLLNAGESRVNSSILPNSVTNPVAGGQVPGGINQPVIGIPGLPGGTGDNTGGTFPGGGNTGGTFPGGGNTGGTFPGGGNTGGTFPGGGNTGGTFPGGGNTGGTFPGGGNTGGTSQGGGNTGGTFPGGTSGLPGGTGGNTGGTSQGGGNTGGIFPGGGNTGGTFPGQGNGNGGTFPGQGNGNDGNFPGQGNGNGGIFPGGGNTGGNFPGGGNNNTDSGSVIQGLPGNNSSGNPNPGQGNGNSGSNRGNGRGNGRD